MSVELESSESLNRPTRTLCSIDVVLPVYNESHVLECSVLKILSACREIQDETRIHIVSNGSTDGTDELSQELADAYEDIYAFVEDEPGRGRALRNAWISSNADLAFYMDIDLSTDLEVLPRAIESLKNGASIVAGSRLNSTSKTQRSLKREILSRGYNFLLKQLTGARSIEDAQCGFKGVRVESVRQLLSSVENDNWFFDTELLVLAEWAGLGIESIPVTWTEDADSRVKLIPTIVEEFLGLCRLVPRRPFKANSTIRRTAL